MPKQRRPPGADLRPQLTRVGTASSSIKLALCRHRAVPSILCCSKAHVPPGHRLAHSPVRLLPHPPPHPLTTTHHCPPPSPHRLAHSPVLLCGRASRDAQTPSPRANRARNTTTISRWCSSRPSASRGTRCRRWCCHGGASRTSRCCTAGHRSHTLAHSLIHSPMHAHSLSLTHSISLTHSHSLDRSL